MYVCVCECACVRACVCIPAHVRWQAYFQVSVVFSTYVHWYSRYIENTTHIYMVYGNCSIIIQSCELDIGTRLSPWIRTPFHNFCVQVVFIGIPKKLFYIFIVVNSSIDLFIFVI